MSDENSNDSNTKKTDWFGLIKIISTIVALGLVGYAIVYVIRIFVPDRPFIERGNTDAKWQYASEEGGTAQWVGVEADAQNPSIPSLSLAEFCESENASDAFDGITDANNHFCPDCVGENCPTEGEDRVYGNRLVYDCEGAGRGMVISCEKNFILDADGKPAPWKYVFGCWDNDGVTIRWEGRNDKELEPYCKISNDLINRDAEADAQVCPPGYYNMKRYDCDNDAFTYSGNILRCERIDPTENIYAFLSQSNDVDGTYFGDQEKWQYRSNPSYTDFHQDFQHQDLRCKTAVRAKCPQGFTEFSQKRLEDNFFFSECDDHVARCVMKPDPQTGVIDLNTLPDPKIVGYNESAPTGEEFQCEETDTFCAFDGKEVTASSKDRIYKDFKRKQLQRRGNSKKYNEIQALQKAKKKGYKPK